MNIFAKFWNINLTVCGRICTVFFYCETRELVVTFIMLIEFLTKILFMFNHPNHQQLVASSTWQNLFFFLINHENFLTVVKNLRSKIQNQLSCPQSLSGYSFSMISIIISNIFPEIAKFINILKTKYAFFPDESYSFITWNITNPANVQVLIRQIPAFDRILKIFVYVEHHNPEHHQLHIWLFCL